MEMETVRLLGKLGRRGRPLRGFAFAKIEANPMCDGVREPLLRRLFCNLEPRLLSIEQCAVKVCMNPIDGHRFISPAVDFRCPVLLSFVATNLKCDLVHVMSPLRRNIPMENVLTIRFGF